MAKIAECKSEEQWRAEYDARSLAEAEAIRADPKRMTAAQKAAKGMNDDAQLEAKLSAARASAIAKLAGNGKAAKPDAAKPAATTAKAKRTGGKSKK